MIRLTPRHLTLLAVIAFGSLTLTGCTFGLGEREFRCNAPEGVKCQSARQIYERGGSSELVNGTTAAEPLDLGYDPRDRWPNAPWTNAPTIDAPQPVRRPPQIMRAYIHPYEDAKGDLHMPGLIYTEIERRRWHVTDFALNRDDDAAGSNRPRDPRAPAQSTGQPVR